MRTSDIKSRFEKRARTKRLLERSAVGLLIVVLLLVEPFVGPVHAKKNPPGHVNPDPGHIKGAGWVPARGGEAEIWVYPRNRSPRDAQNVQWAVDNVASGGTVYLMSTDPDSVEPKPFLFGYGAEGDRFVIGQAGNDVSIVGQTRLAHNPVTDRPTGDVIGIPTVIRGGHNTFVSGATGEDLYGIPGTNVFGDRTPRVRLEIQGILFEECLEACIWIAGSTGLEISGNKFVRPRLLGVSEPHPLGHAVFMGLGPDPDSIEWFRQNVFGLPPAGVSDHDVSGTVVVRGNYVQGEAFSSADLQDFGPDDHPVFYEGAYYSGCSNGFCYVEGVDAVVIIENNVVDTVLSTGICGFSNKGTGGNTTIVQNNLVVQGHHGWERFALGTFNLKSGQFLNNDILDTDNVMYISATSGLVFRGNTASGDGQSGIGVYEGSNNNVIEVRPGELDGFYPAEFHIMFDPSTSDNTVYLNGVTGLAIIDQSNNLIVP